MELNLTSLRPILARILSLDEAYVVPKQGNFWNPQEQLTKPDTWCAYLIRSNTPRTKPFYSATSGVNAVYVEKIARIDLQFVGPQAEAMAGNVAFWPLRKDVQDEFSTVRGSVMRTDMDARSSVYFQDGRNTVIAWNTGIRVLWWSVVETGQKRLTGDVVLQGQIVSGDVVSG